MRQVVAHFSPHPDDEVLGAPATLMAMRDAGWTVVNVACGLGRQVDATRRRAELEEACRRAHFELIIPVDLPGITGADDLARAQAHLSEIVLEIVASHHCRYVVSPSPHDGHHGHEVVARAVRDALALSSDPMRWGMWGLWSDLALPNLYVPFDASRLAEITWALRAHVGEVERNDYVSLVESRARMNAILGAERVFGFGAHHEASPLAELLLEVVHTECGWHMPLPRMFGTEPSPPDDADVPIGWWLERQSDRSRLRSVRSAGP